MRRILIVDDEPGLRLVLQLQLQSEFECEVVQASGGTEALRIISERPIDVIISDLCMPEGSGEELLEALRSANSGIPTFIFTGSSDKSHLLKMMSPLVAVFSKPDVKPLIGQIHELIRRQNEPT